MIMSMCKVVCVTNRRLCQGSLVERIKKIGQESMADYVILRERDLPEPEYEALAGQVIQVCEEQNMTPILHSYIPVLERLAKESKKKISFHLPVGRLGELTQEQRICVELLGASVHSLQDALEAQEKGCDYIVAGHIFDTDCKAGVPGRGLEFLKEICSEVEIPVYAIGGINKENASSVLEAGASGVCLMSGLMVTEHK